MQRSPDSRELTHGTWPTAGQCILIASLLAPGSPALAQAPPASSERETPIETDRPGNAYAATTVPQWSFQIETSVNYAFDAESSRDSNLVSFPTLLRFGVLPFLELRAGTSIVGIDVGSEADVANPTDTSLGTKLQALENDAWMPDLAVVADVFLPSGRGVFTAGAVVPDVRLATSWELPAGFAILVNAGADVPEDADGRFARFVYVGNLKYAPPIEGRWFSLFVEGFGRIPRGSRLPVVQIDAGATFLLGENWQVDVFSQHAFTDESPDHQISLGLSTRIGG